MDLHLDRTMLPAALDGLRGPFRLRLASAFNHRPEDFNRNALYPGAIENASFFCEDLMNTQKRQ
jgi:hypothetical protein